VVVMRREDGNVLLLTLMVGVILMALLAAEVTVTRVNVRAVQSSTVNAQLDVQAILSSPNAMRDAVARLPAEITARAGFAPSSFGDNLQTAVDRDWGQCSATGRLITRVRLNPTICGVTSSVEDRATFRPLSSGNASEVRIPLTIQTTYTDTLGRRSRQARGEVVYRLAGTSALPITMYQVLADRLGAPLPDNLILDGPIQVNGPLTFAAGRSEFLSGVSSATAQLQLGSTTVTPRQFAPSVAFPCDQLNSTCPKFNAGLSLTAPRLPIPIPGEPADLTLSAATQDIVLSPNPARGTTIYTCTLTSCERYWYAPDGNLYQHILPSPVPPENGLPFTPPEPDGGTQPWQPVKTNVTGIFRVAGDVQVRALTPNGPAFQGSLTLEADGTLTVASSLSPVTPTCTTFAVRNQDGSITPANCTSGSPDVLGLISLNGNIDLGSSTTFTADRTLALQANLFAPFGSVSIQDPRVSTLNWVGSVAASTFTPNAGMHLAQDPRLVDPPGFPSLPGRTTAPTVRLEPDGILNTDPKQ